MPSAPSTAFRHHPSVTTIGVTLLAGVLPLSLLLPGSLKALPPAVLFLYGLYLLLLKPDVRRRFWRAWPVIVTSNLILIWALVNAWMFAQGASDLDRPAHILLYTVACTVFVDRLRMACWWRLLAVTAIALGLACIVQYFYLDLGRARIPGRTNSSAIVFAIMLASLALASWLHLLRGRYMHWGDKCLHAAALVLAFTGLVLTQSRGPMLAMIGVVLCVLYLHARQTGHYRVLLTWLAVGMLGFAALVVVSHGAMIQRMPEIQQQVSQFRGGKVGGSTSQRLEMWRVAVQGFRQHPWSGVGLGNFQTYVGQEIDAGRASKKIRKYNSPHNVYLTYAVAGGIPALIILLLALLCPLWWFARHFKQADETKATAAWIGFAITLQYALSGITEHIFGWTLSLSFMFFMVLGLAIYIVRPTPVTDLDHHDR